MDVKNEVLACYESIKEKIPFQPLVALVLGSGLGDFAERVEKKTEIFYRDIPGFPISGVKGHKGCFVFAYVQGVPVVMMQGRVHYYEGYPMQKVVLPIRLMAAMGAKAIFLTNAAGSLRMDYKPGSLMLLRDHISSFVPSPLIGPNVDDWGPRFPDMSHVYDRELCGAVEEAARAQQLSLQQGVYIQLTGPQYETPSEVKLCRMLGADAVGMSTVCEAIAAHHMGVRVCGISCLTNYGTGLTDQPLSHQEVEQTGREVAQAFAQLIKAAISRAAKIL